LRLRAGRSSISRKAANVAEWRITGRSDDLDDARVTCAVCGEQGPLEWIFGHLRGAHDMDVEIDTWPDGEPVIVDTTLEPEDFGTSRDES
jgi:hypothetical protein